MTNQPKCPECRVYFAVPNHYTQGREFETYAEAAEYAHSTIRPFVTIPGYSRAFVDVRISEPTENGSVDRVLHRVEIFHDSLATV